MPTHILGVYNLPADDLHPHHTVSILYLGRKIAGELVISHESTDIGYFKIDTINIWHHAHDIKAKEALEFQTNPRHFSAIKISE